MKKKIFSYPEAWIESIYAELDSYEYWSKQNSLLSMKRRTEHIQRALEKAVKFPFLIIGEIVVFVDPILNQFFKAREFSNTFSEQFLNQTNNLIMRLKSYTQPKELHHIPSQKLLPIMNEMFMHLRRESVGRDLTEKVLDEISKGGFVSKIDGETYLDFIDIVLKYFDEVENNSLISKKAEISTIIDQTVELMSKVPDYNVMFMPFAATSLKLFHTLLGYMAMFTELKTYEPYLRMIDNYAASKHNELVDESLDSEYFNITYGFYMGILNLMSLFPLSGYLGKYYENPKYAVRDADPLFESYNNPSFSDLLDKSIKVITDSVSGISLLLTKASQILEM